MRNLKFDSTLKIGLLLATLAWFSYIFYDFNISIYSRHTTFPGWIEDIPGAWGLGFRTAAGAIALITVLLFVFKREFSRLEATVAFRFVLLFEAVYFASFLGGGLNVWKHGFFTLHLFLEQGLPCIVQGILIPTVLIKLFLELNPNKPRSSSVKWALTYVTAFIFVFWLNNMGYWVGTVVEKGADYVTLYPINLLSFVVTVAGLLVLFLYSADFSSKWLRTGILEKLDLRKISATITLLGLYSLFIFLLWLFFGSVGGWSTWYAWFLGHGYMSFIALPITFVSLPLLFRSLANSGDSKLESGKRTMLNLDRKPLTALLLLTQALGIVFFTIFSLAYYIPIPTRNFLIGTEPFLLLMQIFGTLFLAFALVLIAISFRTRITDKNEIGS